MEISFIILLINVIEILCNVKEERMEMKYEEPSGTYYANFTISAASFSPKMESPVANTWYEFFPRRKRSLARKKRKRTKQLELSRVKNEPKREGEEDGERSVDSDDDDDDDDKNTGKDNRCVICDVQFRFGKHYERHCRESHGIGLPYKCDYCPQRYSYKRTTNRHMKMTHGVRNENRHDAGENSPFCDICEVDLKSFAAFEKHALSKHKSVKMMRCRQCPREYFRRIPLLIHTKKAHGKPNHAAFICEFCRNVFDRTDELNEHRTLCRRRQLKKRKGSIVRSEVKANGENVRFPCNAKGCGGNFDALAALKQHYRRAHPKAKLYACDHCEEAFNVKKCYERHVDKRHAENDGEAALSAFHRYHKGNVYTCPYCKTGVGGLKAYEKHSREHPGSPMFFCEECGKGFTRRSGLWIHANEVHGDFTFKKSCAYCERYYFRSGHLNRHEKSCKKRKDKRDEYAKAGRGYFCEACRKIVYMPYSTFRWHVSKHEDHDFCRICDTPFRKSGYPKSLANHMRMRHPTECIGDDEAEKREAKEEMDELEYIDENIIIIKEENEKN